MKTKRLSFILIVLVWLLGACGIPLTPFPLASISPTLAPTGTPTVTLALPATETPPAPTSTLTPTLTPVAPTQSPTASPSPTATPIPQAKRVLIISFDGLRPDAIALAPMPRVMEVLGQGAFSLTAQTVFRSSTLPSHTSMLTGFCPAKHGVTWNDYKPANGYAIGTDLFDLAHAAGLKTAMYVGKQKLRQITEPSSTDIFEFIPNQDRVIAETLIANFPTDFGVLFVHFPNGDWIGHSYGWLSEAQLGVYERADQALGSILDTLDSLGLRDETLIILTADHGGHGTSHGSLRIEDMTIPWVISGPGVLRTNLTAPIHTMDTAATAAWALGLPLPPEWDGQPAYQAYGLPALPRAEPVCETP
jgi:hypothetical protein